MKLIEKLNKNAENKIFTDDIKTIMSTHPDVYIPAISNLCDILEEYASSQRDEDEAEQIAKQLSVLENIFDEMEAIENEAEKSEECTDWKTVLMNEPIKPIISWLETKGLDISDRRFLME